MKKNKSGLFYSKSEEYINSITHLFGGVVGLGVCIYFLYRCYSVPDHWAAAGVWLYLIGMCGSYAASAIYHSFKHHDPRKKIARHFDHAAIYWHIAGSYSPITLTVLRCEGAWGWGLFAFVWACAIAGTIVSFRPLKDHSNIETICFVVMGLSVLVAFKPLLEVARIPAYWIIGEGVAYITGAVLYSFKSIRYAHSVFHVFVLLGEACHIVATWMILDSYLA